MNGIDKLYVVFGMIGAICFLIGDVLLGWVDPGTVDKRTHSYITEGHGKGYSSSKIAVTMTLAAIGIPFMYLGMVHCGESPRLCAHTITTWRNWREVFYKRAYAGRRRSLMRLPLPKERTLRL